MSDTSSADILSRRKFLGAASLAGAGVALGAKPAMAEGAKPDPLITEVQDWNRYLGDGVQKTPYGMPSKFEKNVIRRDVSWLTASPESSVRLPSAPVSIRLSRNMTSFSRSPIWSARMRT